MKKILVTGSNGFLGQKITERFFAGRDFELIATSRGKNRFPETAGYDYFDLDLTDHAAVAALLEEIKPGIIINTAAMALPDQCEKDPVQCEAINVVAVQHLAGLCRQLNIHLIHLSTDFIFNGKSGPYRENDEQDPLSLYGNSKAAAEELIKASGARWAILRTVLVYGFVRGHSRSNIVLWVKSALEKGTAIRVVADQYRSPTLADDLADGCIIAAMNRAEGIFNISGGEQMSVYELALKVARFWKLDPQLITPVATATLNEIARRPMVTGFIVDKARRELGYNPRSVDAGLAIVDEQLRRIS